MTGPVPGEARYALFETTAGPRKALLANVHGKSRTSAPSS